MKRKNPIALLFGWLALSLAPTHGAHGADGSAAGATQQTGIIEGRVLNASSGSYLNNARVVIDDTRIETFTNESGEFRLTNVPAGPVRILALFTGLEAQAATVTVTGGQVATQDFSLLPESFVMSRRV